MYVKLSEVVVADIKISDSEFLAILRENSGLFANTAKAIEERFGISYSRQAVRQRALDHKEELEDIEEESLDIAEAGMKSLMTDFDKDIKFKSCQFVLKTKGKKRGYVERTENAITDPDGNALQPIININVVNPKPETE